MKKGQIEKETVTIPSLWPATLVGDRPLGPLIRPAIRAGLRMI